MARCQSCEFAEVKPSFVHWLSAKSHPTWFRGLLTQLVKEHKPNKGSKHTCIKRIAFCALNLFSTNKTGRIQLLFIYLFVLNQSCTHNILTRGSQTFGEQESITGKSNFVKDNLQSNRNDLAHLLFLVIDSMLAT